MEKTPVTPPRETLKTLPGDDVRQIMWRYQDRYDLQMLIQSSRSVARGVVARLVAAGARRGVAPTLWATAGGSHSALLTWLWAVPLAAILPCRR